MNKYVVECYFEETGEWDNILDDYIYASSSVEAMDYFIAWYSEKTGEFPHYRIRVSSVEHCFTVNA